LHTDPASYLRRQKRWSSSVRERKILTFDSSGSSAAPAAHDGFGHAAVLRSATTRKENGTREEEEDEKLTA
jgi:hypothetical protein